MSEQISTASAQSSPTSRGESHTSGKARPRLNREGIALGDQLVPVLSGSVHYFRLEPESWRACLEALRDMGCTMVDVYVPWSVHEREDGSFDFGQHEPRLDVAAFLRLAGELGLYALVRPGPHINAELSGFGLPERVLWDLECQARSPAGAPVVLPMPPRAFPVPSYASRKLIAEATHWLRAAAAELGPLTWPAGPVVLCQVDNEGALYFRDGVYEQDYHPDALALYRRHLEEKYGSLEAARAAYGISSDSFEISPPHRFEARDNAGLLRQQDWAECQERLLSDAFATFRSALSCAGLERAPTCHNLPMGESATPLDPARLGKVVECLGLDYYHVADDRTWDVILRRTTEVTSRADAFDYPSLAIELAAGFPPFFPPLGERDNQYAALACLAAGIRGYNLYMAVERDRWLGAPIDRYGTRRESFDFWARLNEAVTRTRLYGLSRAADVCVIVPRSLHRLERLLHAFGPLSAAAFDIMGLGAYDSCLEQGPFAEPLFDAERYLKRLLGALEELGIAYRLCGNDAAPRTLEGARFGFLVSALGLEPELWESVNDVASRGVPLLAGPHLPTLDPNGRGALPAARSGVRAVTESALGAELSKLAESSGAFRLLAGDGLRTSLFRDSDGMARVLFLTNTTKDERVAELNAPFVRDAVDALDGTSFRATVGRLQVPLSPNSVRMLELK